jgi:uncharacterized protein YkwD
LTNQVRVGENLRPFNVDLDLCVVARAQATRLMQAKAVKAPERDELASQLAAAGYRFVAMGINVAGSEKGVDDAFIGIMKHGATKVEILQSKYIDLGVGVVKADDNAVYVVQVFGAKRKQ